MKQCIVFILLITTFISSKTWIVDVNGTGDYTDIQSAIYSAMDGDTIYVKNGTYEIFGVGDTEISIIGECADSVKIVDDQRGIYISSSKACLIRNLRFTGEILGAIYADAYAYYKDTQVIPEIIIDNCIFDAERSDGQGTSGIVFEITYEDLVNGGVLDSLTKKIKITNNEFINMWEAISFEMGGIISKNMKKTTSIPVINFDCSDNYFGITDSIGIDSLVYDRRDPIDPRLSYLNSNRIFFNFIPWSDSLITNYYEIEQGIRFNNFVNCQTALKSYLIYNDSLVNTIKKERIADSFQLLKAFPNPFNNSTSIEFFLNQPSLVEIKVFNIQGQEIEKLTTQKYLGYGTHNTRLIFEGQASGIYLIKVKTDDITLTTKVSYLK